MDVELSRKTYRVKEGVNSRYRSRADRKTSCASNFSILPLSLFLISLLRPESREWTLNGRIEELKNFLPYEKRKISKLAAGERVTSCFVRFERRGSGRAKRRGKKKEKKRERKREEKKDKEETKGKKKKLGGDAKKHHQIIRAKSWNRTDEKFGSALNRLAYKGTKICEFSCVSRY